MADRPRFSVHFDEEAFTEDLEHATTAGRDVARRECTLRRPIDAGPEEIKRTFSQA